MVKHRRPAWWVLYALVPLMGGLLLAEHHALLTPVWHTCVRIGIVLFIYGLVWIWLHVNTVALLLTDQDTPVRTYVYEAHREALRSRSPFHHPRRAYVGYGRVHQRPRRLKTKTYGMEI